MIDSPFSYLLRRSSHKGFLQLALREARRGMGRTYPNPPVGAVVVKDGIVIATGYHAKAGDMHGEAVALSRAGEAAKGATLYVTLEPCNHFGHTPPCTEHIIRAGVGRVVMLVRDVNPHVEGHGFERLQAAGIEVELCDDDRLAGEGEALITPFVKLATRQIPYIIAKIAASLDGKIAVAQGQQTQLTGQPAQKLVHKLRNACDAVLVGAGTVDIDDPQLNTRLFSALDGHSPTRIVLDRRLQTSEKARVYKTPGASLVVHGSQVSDTRKQAFDDAGVQRLEVDGTLLDIMHAIGSLGFTSVLVEGGAHIFTSFMQAQLVDELWWFTAPKWIGSSGISALSISNFQLQIQNTYSIGDDALLIARTK